MIRRYSGGDSNIVLKFMDYSYRQHPHGSLSTRVEARKSWRDVSSLLYSSEWEYGSDLSHVDSERRSSLDTKS